MHTLDQVVGKTCQVMFFIILGRQVASDKFVFFVLD